MQPTLTPDEAWLVRSLMTEIVEWTDPDESDPETVRSVALAKSVLAKLQ
jgi:hypothetical protein